MFSRFLAASKAFQANVATPGGTAWAKDVREMQVRLGIEAFAVDPVTGEPWQANTVMHVQRSQDCVALAGCGAGKTLALLGCCIARGGVCLIISPLAALASQIVCDAKALGIKAYQIRGSTDAAVYAAVLATPRDAPAVVVVIQPEVFASKTFQREFFGECSAGPTQT